MMDVMRVLVADDELLARKRLLRLLAAMDAIAVAGECESGNAVIERVKTKDVDVILLDVNMPGLTGLEAVDLLPEDGPLVILCTAHADHALQAFELGAVDYIVKPVEAGRLKKALARAREKLEARRHARPQERERERDDAPSAEIAVAPLDGSRSLSRLAIPTRQGIVLLDPRTVSHAVLEGELVSVVTESGTYLSDDTLGDLQERLPRELFERVHRRALLNLEQVARLEPLETGGYLAHTRGGHAVEISRQAARELRKRLKLR
jgi:two-component system LytT family response regulator